MFIELVALTGILYTGYKSFKKQDAESLNKALSKQGQRRKSIYDKRLDQMYKEANSGTGITGLTKKNARELTFNEVNNREIISAAIGMVFSLGGFFVYGPLGYGSIPFILYSAKQVIRESFELMKKKKIDIETLVTMTIFGTLYLKKFFIASFSILLYKLSLKLTSRVIQDSRKQLVDIFQQTPESVWTLVDDVEISVPFNSVKPGDIVIVCAGEIIPVDGQVINGMASVDQHILTGEAMPVEKEIGEEVFAMTIVLSGKIHIKVEKACEESTVAKITHILNTTSDFKSGTQLRADALSRHLVNPALIASIVALPIIGFNGAVAIIICHPKNIMTGIIPISILKHLALASRQGILIKDGRSLELLNKVDTIVFDKTGTLTEEQPHTGTIHCFSRYSEDEVLAYATVAEHKQTHPLAKAIQEEARKRNLVIPDAEYSEYKLGYGLMVTVKGQSVHIGSMRFMVAEAINLPEKLHTLQQRCHEEGFSLVMVAVDRQLVGAIELLPTVRTEAKEIINQLKNRKNIKHTYIISGDNEIPTRKLAQELGIDHYFAQTLPENKAAIIEQLQQEGRFVCYVGDGINDSIALKKAQVSISLAGASKIATDTAQVILMDNGIGHLNLLFDLAENLNTNINTILTLMISPSVVGVSGIFLLGFGVTQIISLGLVGIIAAIGYALVPLPERLSK